MGLSDREYLRDTGRPAGFGSFGWDVIGWLIAITIVTYCVQLLSPPFTEWFDLTARGILRGQLWRLVTFDFLHSPRDPWHIIINLFVLYIAGQKLLSNHTQKEFLLFYLASGLAAGVSFLLWSLLRGDQGHVVGASGSVAAVLLLYAMYWPRDRWLIFYIIPVPVIALVLLSIALDLHPVLYELGTGQRRDNVAHVAHLGGMLFAFLYYRFGWRLEPYVADFSLKNTSKLFKRQPKLRVHRPAFEESNDEMQQRMDELLEKISREGEASLTSSERDTLNRISRELRRRRV
jgi:membrane associated rhomboid family serine protease